MASADGFTEMYQQTYPHVMGYLLRRVGVDVPARWPTRRSPGPGTGATPASEVLPWLLVTARHVLGDQLRRGDHRDALTVKLANSPTPHTPGVDTVALERVLVLTALTTLTDSDRDLLMLVAWDGLTTGQAAQVLGCSAPAAAVRLHRARRRFRDALAASEDAPPSSLPTPPRTGHPTTTGSPQPVRAAEPS